jgi:hypothetical protein
MELEIWRYGDLGEGAFGKKKKKTRTKKEERRGQTS